MRYFYFAVVFAGLSILSFFVTLQFLGPAKHTVQKQNWDKLVWSTLATIKTIKTTTGVSSVAVADGVKLTSSYTKPTAKIWKNAASFVIGKNIKDQIAGRSSVVEFDITCNNPISGQNLGLIYYAFPKGGNSGWKSLELRKGRSKYRLEYQVPFPPSSMKVKDIQYILVRSSMGGEGAPIVVHGAKLFIDTLQQ